MTSPIQIIDSISGNLAAVQLQLNDLRAERVSVGIAGTQALPDDTP